MVINKYIHQQIQTSFREYGLELHKHYSLFENPIIARESPPNRLLNKEDLKVLCDR